jgi:hypothetical protein
MLLEKVRQAFGSTSVALLERYDDRRDRSAFSSFRPTFSE